MSTDPMSPRASYEGYNAPKVPEDIVNELKTFVGVQNPDLDLTWLNIGMTDLSGRVFPLVFDEVDFDNLNMEVAPAVGKLSDRAREYLYRRTADAISTNWLDDSEIPEYIREFTIKYRKIPPLGRLACFSGHQFPHEVVQYTGGKLQHVVLRFNYRKTAYIDVIELLQCMEIADSFIEYATMVDICESSEYIADDIYQAAVYLRASFTIYDSSK